MKKGGTGGANTRTGLLFEERVSLRTLFKKLPGYDVIESSNNSAVLQHRGKVVAKIFQKHGFYKYLKEEGIDWRRHISKQLLPDDALLVVIRDTLFIIEVKFQQVGGSVDEKLQTCDFKRKQYIKLTRGLNLRVEYVYVLSDWFKKESYRDALAYIESVNCHYMFNYIPIKWFGLPDPETDRAV